jgi:hypothetical protein
MKANVMKEEIISPLESIVYYYDQNKELVLSCFIKPSQAIQLLRIDSVFISSP